jgi:hypothetical protein
LIGANLPIRTVRFGGGGTNNFRVASRLADEAIEREGYLRYWPFATYCGATPFRSQAGRSGYRMSVVIGGVRRE